MKAIFDELDELDGDELPAHSKRAFVEWVRRNPSRLPLIERVPLVEEPMSVRAPDALQFSLILRNQITKAPLLLDVHVGEYTTKDLRRLQVRCHEVAAEEAMIVATEYDYVAKPAIERSAREDSIAIALIHARFHGIADEAFAPRLEPVLVPPNFMEENQHGALRRQKDFADVRTLRKAFWTHVRVKYPRWDRTTEDLGLKHRYRPSSVTGLNIGYRILRDGLVIWISRKGHGASGGPDPRLKFKAAEVIALTGGELDEGKLPFLKMRSGYLHELSFDEAAVWLKTETDRYEAALKDILGATA